MALWDLMLCKCGHPRHKHGKGTGTTAKTNGHGYGMCYTHYGREDTRCTCMAFVERSLA